MGSSFGISPKPYAQHTTFQYVVFIITFTVLSSLLVVTTPLLILRAQTCVGLDCLSMERDLRRSMDVTKDPCHNFYDYVCSRWARLAGTRYTTPLQKYSTNMDKFLLRNMVLRSMTELKDVQDIRDKATTLLAKCAQRLQMEDHLVNFLRSLGLPWPSRSEATAQDVLDIFAGSSLDYGVPAIWSFLVGRNPKRSQENIIYLTFDFHLSRWFNHFQRLENAGQVRHYLRACAETVGGKGQSYDRMIHDVILIHGELSQKFSSQLSVFEPGYLNYSDIELRLAVNKHLPDESQQWPQDEILCLQKSAFLNFSRAFLRKREKLMQLKLYIGAYLVWYLSPLTSTYLTSVLMEGMNRKANLDNYVRHRCFDAVGLVMPLVVWKTNMNTLTETGKGVIFKAFGNVWQSVVQEARSYSPKAAVDMEKLVTSLKLNAFNLSITWDILEKAYAYVPKLKGRFFDMYSDLARATATFAKVSMRKPSSDILHVPGIVNYNIYRLLVCREIRIPKPFIFRPVFSSTTPLTVRMATLGTHFATSVTDLLYFAYLLNREFEPYTKQEALNSSSFPSQMQDKFFALQDAIRARYDATRFSSGDLLFLLLQSIGVNFAYAALKKLGKDENSRGYESFPRDRLFFLATCFVQCNSAGMDAKGEQTCNWVVPQTRGFAEVFKCKKGQRMFIDLQMDW